MEIVEKNSYLGMFESTEVVETASCGFLFGVASKNLTMATTTPILTKILFFNKKLEKIHTLVSFRGAFKNTRKNWKIDLLSQELRQ